MPVASAGEEASFRLDRMPFDFDHKPGSIVQKASLQTGTVLGGSGYL